MSHFAMRVRHFVKDDEAATMVEYALMVALVAVFCVVAVTALGTSVRTVFTSIATSISAA